MVGGGGGGPRWAIQFHYILIPDGTDAAEFDIFSFLSLFSLEGKGKYSLTTPIKSLPNPRRTDIMIIAQKTKSKATSSKTKPG